LWQGCKQIAVTAIAFITRLAAILFAYFDSLFVCSYNVTTLWLLLVRNYQNMSTAIRTRIIRIGNSQGIRIPKILLEQSGIRTEVEIEVEGDHLTIRPMSQLRIGWDKAFTNMSEQQDDVLLDDVNPTDWDQVEWEW